MIIETKLGKGLMIATGLAMILSGCQNKQTTDASETEKTEKTADYKKFSDSGAAKNGKTEEGDETEEREKNGNSQKAAEPAIPLAFTIEHVTDTVSEERGCETYKYPRFYLNEEEKAVYPKLNEAFEEYNRQVESQKKAILEELKSDYDATAENRTEDISIQMTSEITARALRADSNVVSILREHYDYAGGIHGYYYTDGINFDAKTGKELTLADVIEDQDTFTELVSEAFVRDYSGTAGYDTLMDAGEQLKNWDFDSNEHILWTIDPTCVSLYFAPYVLGSYAHGEQVVSIYFDEAPEIFNETYTMACEDYILPVTNRKPLSILTDSGEREKISAEANLVYSGDYAAYKVAYTIGDTNLSSEYECYGADIYLAHTNGENYIYAFQSTDNGATYLSVVNADKKTFDDEKNIDTCRKEYYKNGDTEDPYELIQGSTAFTDPSKFTLGFSVDVLGTYYAYKDFHIGEDGYPVSDDQLYASGASTAFRAIREITCDTVDEKGNVTGKAAIPAGSYLVVARTDGEKIADLQIVDPSCITEPSDSDWPVYNLNKDIEEIMNPDKTIYRVTTDNQYPYQVNGEDEEGIFEGVLRAG